MIKVLVVDRSEFLRAGLRRSLEAQPDMEVVGAFGEVAPAMAELDRLDPQVVLLSVTMPEMSGFEACKQVLERAPGARVVMLSWKLTDRELAAAFLAGAAGYLTKDSSPDDLVRTVRANAAGELFLVAPVAELLLKFRRRSKRLDGIGCPAPRKG